MRRNGPLARRRRLHVVTRVARDAGRLDAAGQLGNVGMSMLKSVRREALTFGCQRFDVDEATIHGLEEGRSHVYTEERRAD